MLCFIVSAFWNSSKLRKKVKVQKSTIKKKLVFFAEQKKLISFFHWAKKTKVFSTEQKKLNFCFWKFSGFFSGFCPHRQDSFRFALIFSFVKHDFSCAFFSYYKKLLKNVLYYETIVFCSIVWATNYGFHLFECGIQFFEPTSSRILYRASNLAEPSVARRSEV